MKNTGKRIAVLMTSEIHNTYDVDCPKVAEDLEAGLTFYSTGKLEALRKMGETVVVVSTRTELRHTDGWWLELVGTDNIFLTPPNNTRDMCVANPALLMPWRKLFEREGVDWPTEPMYWDIVFQRLDELTGGKIVCGSIIASDAMDPAS